VKRVYIAGPMTGKPLYNFPAFDHAKAQWADAGYAVVSPADITRQVWFARHERTFDPAIDRADYGDPILVDMMREDLAAAAECDLIAVLPGWEKSRGALREVAVAQNHGAELFDAVTFKPLELRVALTVERTNETVLEEAQRLVYGDRQAAYGHPYDDYERTSRMWEGFLGLPEGFIGPRKAILMMALMKVSREGHGDGKRDNRVDGAGYFGCAQLVAEREAELRDESKGEARLERMLSFLELNAQEAREAREARGVA
jgi:hypothetical protein